MKSVSCWDLSNSLWPSDCSPPGSSVHEILQARIVEWVAMLSSRGSSWLRDRTQILCIADGLLAIWTIGEAQKRDGYYFHLQPFFSEATKLYTQGQATLEQGKSNWITVNQADYLLFLHLQSFWDHAWGMINFEVCIRVSPGVAHT